MTLWDIKVKQIAQIHSLSSMLSSAVSQRLDEMGFNPGQNVICLRRSPLKGPVVVQIGDSVYSLEQNVANKIQLA
ncbi:FeoA family protein [Neptunicella marina]|uniref:Ferrous iron transport protein A n=1 Tax=Neptunicella marina TaxID=2125989 RepID=A0A8J6LX60_9ALTE|nr:FeoA family protein [Neptunicella marina]MBC3764600.1 ferrous iron transport protein A [Neptunicella marina]